MNSTLSINISRLENNINELSKFGKNNNNGIDRALGDETYKASYLWLIDYWKNKLKLPVTIDAIANLWATKSSNSDMLPIVYGSHHDAVSNGGMYDGALGVLLATEVMETLIENNINLKHPFKIISFVAEEPNPFNLSTLGSKVISGRLKKADLIDRKDFSGNLSLIDVIKSLGGNLNNCEDILSNKKDIAAFIECHIEQGRRLLDKNIPLASVSCITGIYRENIKIIGETNHAGTTIMNDRKDALVAASDLNIRFEKLIKKYNCNELVGTISYLTVTPNSVGVIPGEVNLIVEIRSSDSNLKKSVLKDLETEIKEIEMERNVSILRELNLDQSERYMDKTIQKIINKGITTINEPTIELVSMAGHDAANMQLVTKAGMLFVRCNGKSHCFDESANINDIEKAGNALLQTLFILDKELD